MKVTGLVFCGISLVLAIALGVWVGRFSSVSKTHGQSSTISAPYVVTLSGEALTLKASELLAIANASRSQSRKNQSDRSPLLERVSFERSAGRVVARGEILSSYAMSPIRVVIDAFDASDNYVASGASEFAPGLGSSPFSASMIDVDTYEKFSVRFLSDGGAEIPIRHLVDQDRTIPPLLLDDILFAGDMPELWSRLAQLNYTASPTPLGDASLLTLVTRFRRDHHMKGPDIVTIGDLLAARAVSPLSGVTKVVFDGY